MSEQRKIIGIDLGTTNSLIGVMEAGFPILIADKNGARLTPSVVHFPAEGDPIVGQPAAVAAPQRAQERLGIGLTGVGADQHHPARGAQVDGPEQHPLGIAAGEAVLHGSAGARIRSHLA